jgi:hypothetical protein
MGDTVNPLDEMIKKSLDQIDTLAEDYEALSKAQADEDLSPGGISEDAPNPAEEGEGNEGNPEEGAGEPDMDEGDKDNDSEGEEDEEEDEEVEKSLQSDMQKNGDVKKALEVSEFLNQLVKSISNVLGVHTEDLQKSMQSTEHSNELLAKSLLGMTKAHQTIMKSQSELHKSILEINKRLGAIEHQPMVRKSVASTAQPIEKSFDLSGGNPATSQQSPSTTLSKSQMSAKLMDAFNSGRTELMTDILALEGVGSVEALSPEARAVIGQ